MEPGEYLNEATRLKRAKDLKGSVAAIDRAQEGTPIGAGLPQIFKKRISYLLLDERPEEAVSTANRMIDEALGESRGDRELVGVWYSRGYWERSRALRGLRNYRQAFEDDLRAAWHWFQAMKLQVGTEDEHTPDTATGRLLENWEGWGMKDDDVFPVMEKGIRNKDAESMVRRFRDLELKEPIEDEHES